MQHFYVWKFNRTRRLFVVVSLAFIAALYVWVQSDGVMSVFSKKGPAALARGNPDAKDIGLTFNISWGEEKVHDILKQLKDSDATATFFVSGEWAERHPDILEAIIADKHELGMLGYRYKSYLDQELSQVRKDLIYAKEVFRKLGYKDIQLLRTPSGHFSEEIIELAESLDFQVIHWNVNPNDWKNPGTQEITDFVLKETDNGDIILLHASDAAKQTAGALKTILPGLKNKGYQFATISEIIHQAEAKEKIVE
ncbi:polysaccharide deacetylase family sporulation protein PdaB [Ornithinibacillus gellani]|uniref:polysaccharide deacetylase family sporulation protein PdaB n=1 Tax=Ornithinibacillus gellani TaxID=2293253 RepID=UPI000F472B96|nr:polysaccharide deacetylase family sporulation protein PdaB [Ornithinibacillus gellani]TQS76164.1 polysaccharide deacetylase family sporulation protein PdaB [Ornithinibacillus gellani]